MFTGLSGTDNSPILLKGLLGKAAVTPGSNTLVYTLSKTKEFSNVFINVLNISAIPADITIYVSAANVLTTEDLIEAGVTIEPKGLLTRSIVRMSAGESVYVSATASVVARIEGYEGLVV